MPSVILPWPPKQLTPNFKRRSHWSKYRGATAGYRLACKALTKAARLGICAGDVPIFLMITFRPPDRRLRDDDGMVAAFKAGRDGIADALGIDDRFFRASYTVGEPVKDGAVIVEVRDSGEARPIGEVLNGIVERIAERMEKVA